MKLPPNLNVYVSALLFVVGAYVTALYLGMIVWTFRDIRSRTRDTLAHIMAALLVAVFSLPGLIVYLLIRPKNTLAEEYDRSLAEEAVLHELEEKLSCPECQHVVQADFVVCPYCHHQLKLRCVGCGRLLQPDWEICPYCGAYQQAGKGHEHSLEAAREDELESAGPEAETEPEDEQGAPPLLTDETGDQEGQDRSEADSA